MGGALDGARVLELVDEPAVEYCGRILAGLGADVVKLEPAQGSPSRRVGPFVGDEEGPDRSLSFWHHNVGKRSAVVDDARAAELCRVADVLVHTMRDVDAAGRGLGWERLSELNPALVVCAVTPFGQDGPWAEYQADDLVLMALGGTMITNGYPPREGVYDTPPLTCYGDQAWHTAATYAAIAVLAALWAGEGQFVDVSAHQASASMTEWHLVNFMFTGEPSPRGGMASLGVTAADGRQVVCLNPDFLGPHVFTNLLAMLEADDVTGPLSDPAFEDPVHRARNYGEIGRATRRLAALHDGEELWRMGQAAGLPWGVVRAPEETLDDRHLRARGHFVDVEHPEMGCTVTYSGAPFLAHGSPWAFRRRPPLLGEHTDEVLRGE